MVIDLSKNAVTWIVQRELWAWEAVAHGSWCVASLYHVCIRTY